ncbi:MAG TPA: glycosyltransferase family 2 protein [Negativicutes bacterium]|nr:glycosyltransferase family 2 protein [Negativicutes bacterium]
MMYGSVSVIIPVYNSESSLRELYERLESVLKSIADEYEIIMVDDGSRDNSYGEMKRLYQKGGALRIIGLEGNFGQQNAIMCGLRHAAGDYIVTMDDDLQNPPVEIPKLLEGLASGYDVVYGIPAERKQYGLRNAGTILTDLFFTLVCRKPWNVRVGSFRAMKRGLAGKIIDEGRPFVYITAITLKHTRNIGNVEVMHEERKYGSSNYSFRKLVSLFWRLAANYSGLACLLHFDSSTPQYVIRDMGE